MRTTAPVGFSGESPAEFAPMTTASSLSRNIRGARTPTCAIIGTRKAIGAVENAPAVDSAAPIAKPAQGSSPWRSPMAA